MCECGCVGSDVRLSFPGPGESFYLLTLSRGCEDCDAASGISIERISPGQFMHRKQSREEFIDGELEFEKWHDNEGVGIVTGLRKHEFVSALKEHLVGVDSRQLGDQGVIDEIGAEVILDEAYPDSVVKPHVPATHAV